MNTDTGTFDMTDAHPEMLQEGSKSELNALLCCPHCRYTEQQYKANQAKWGGCGDDWDNYKPYFYKDPLLSEWVLTCNNCGMVMIFPGENIERAIDAWNKIARAT